MTQNEHVYAICCRPDVDDNDVISYENVKTLWGLLTDEFWNCPLYFFPGYFKE